MIGENYLHVQYWRPNFIANEETIKLLPVWVRFSVLHVEYYTVKWLHRAGNKIGRTLKVDDATLYVSRGKFARVCVEIDVSKPLKPGYILRERNYHIQYEGLNTLCFDCGHYEHKTSAWPEKSTTSG